MCVFIFCEGKSICFNVNAIFPDIEKLSAQCWESITKFWLTVSLTTSGLFQVVIFLYNRNCICVVRWVLIIESRKYLLPPKIRTFHHFHFITSFQPFCYCCCCCDLLRVLVISYMIFLILYLNIAVVMNAWTATQMNNIYLRISLESILRSTRHNRIRHSRTPGRSHETNNIVRCQTRIQCDLRFINA